MGKVIKARVARKTHGAVALVKRAHRVHKKALSFGQRHKVLGALDHEVIHRTASFIVLADALMKGYKPFIAATAAFGVWHIVTVAIGVARGAE